MPKGLATLNLHALPLWYIRQNEQCVINMVEKTYDQIPARVALHVGCNNSFHKAHPPKLNTSQISKQPEENTCYSDNYYMWHAVVYMLDTCKLENA